MVYALITDIAAPIGMYDAVHAETSRHDIDSFEGLLVHLGLPTPDGFQVIEVWASQEHYDRYNREIIAPLMTRLGAEPSQPAPARTTTEVDLHGLVIHHGPVVI